MNFTPEFLQELHDRNDIVEVISSFVPLKKRGRIHSAVCPFHNEKTPSFTVYEDTSSFYCFGCGTGGDVITFVKLYENLDYVETIKYLANRAALKLPDEKSDIVSKQKSTIISANKKAARFFFDMLNSEEGKTARAYLRHRGLRDAIITRFGIGYAPDSFGKLRDHLKSLGFFENDLVLAGLCSRGKNGNVYDFFRNRVLFPIIDIRGNVVGFSGRRIRDEDSPRKYVNTSETPVYKKSELLFAMNLAKSNKTRRIILAEGQLDAIALHSAGFSEAVAVLGTSLTDNHVRQISQYADQVVIAYDNDQAGMAATKKALDKFRNSDIIVKVVNIDHAKDVDEYIAKFGAAAFEQLINGSDNSLEYELKKAKVKADLTVDTGKLQYINEACDILSNCVSKTETDLYAGRVAEEIKIVSKSAILEQIEQIRSKRSYKRKKADEKASADVAKRWGISAQNIDRISKVSTGQYILAMLTKNPEFYKEIKNVVTKEDFENDDFKEIFSVMNEVFETDNFIGLSSITSRLSQSAIGALAGCVARFDGINFTKDDAKLYAKKMSSSRAVLDKEGIENLSPEQLKMILEIK